jgi:predicted nucleic acid-binding protein
LIVADASVIANAFGDAGIEGAKARAILRAHDVSLPDLADVEVASALRGRWLAKQMTAKRFAEAVADLADLPAIRYPVLPFMRRAVELRANVTPYDAVYIALAELLGCTLVTTDSRLARAPGPRCEIEVLS